MFYYIENKVTDPRYNLALEQFVFDELDRRHSYFMLWQNHNSIIVGKHQNTLGEINAAFVEEKEIRVVRRLSGGGAVYHDLGNLNFTFITGANKNSGVVDFASFCASIQKALGAIGVPVEMSGRNDMTVDGRKFSGNAQYIKEGRVMHHGTILYDSDLGVLSRALNVPKDKIESKGVKSVKNRVANIRPYLKNDMSLHDFWAALKTFMFREFDMREFALSSDDKLAVEKIKDSVYAQWSWNYGASPPYNIRKVRRIDGCGEIEVLLDVGREGIIKNVSFYGDFFSGDDLVDFGNKIAGRHLERKELDKALSGLDFSWYIHNLDKETFLSLLCD